MYKIWISLTWFDKSQNIDQISLSDSSKILHKKITEMYKIDNKDTVNHFDKDTAKCAKKLNIKDKRNKLNEEKNIYFLQSPQTEFWLL